MTIIGFLTLFILTTTSLNLDLGDTLLPDENIISIDNTLKKCTPGTSCDDGDSCTVWDKYDYYCNCKGSFADSDGDGVCDAEDVCLGEDDNVDKNKNGIPDGCEKKIENCSECVANEKGEITICWIPTNKYNLKTIRGDCRYLHKFFNEDGSLKGKSQCGPCNCEMIGDKDTDGDGICDSKDDCPDQADVGPCGCGDQDTDGDGVCDSIDLCPGFDDNEDADGDGVADGCDLCPNNPDKTDTDGLCGCYDQDTDGDGICDSVDCMPTDPNLPTTPGMSCDDGNVATENDIIQADGCSCQGTAVSVCSITAVVRYLVCDDNGTPANGDDDTYSFSLTATGNNAGMQWEGSFSNTFLGVFAISPTSYGEIVILGPFAADKFIANNVSPPLEIEGGIVIDISVNSVGDNGCSDAISVFSTGDCACDDSDGDGICDLDDCAPDNNSLPSATDTPCDDGNPDTTNDMIKAGSCDCIGIPDVCPDGDADGVCDDDDICVGHPDHMDSDGDGVPDGCDECPNNKNLTSPGDCGCEDCPIDSCDDFCTPDNAKSEYEWIDKISINALENESGDDGGYADHRDMSISLGHGDSVSFWIFPEFLEAVCELSLHVYVDWNGDCDFDDEDELVAWHRTDKEAGADIAIPFHAIEGKVTVRFMLHNGRIRDGCQPYIDGEVEDYSLDIFSRALEGSKPKSKKLSPSTSNVLRISPNPITIDKDLMVDINTIDNQEVKGRLISISGTQVKSFRLKNGLNMINILGLDSGVYFIEINEDNHLSRAKIVIQK